MLAEAGFYVICFDNRDIGRSTSFDDAGHTFPPQLWEPIVTAVAVHAGLG